MNFLFTTYIFPIKEEIVLSKELNLVLDNPRTKDEINLIKENLKVSFDSPDAMYKHDSFMRLPISNTNKDIISIELILNTFYENNMHMPYINEFYSLNKNDDILEQISKMWVIARFDDEGESKRLHDASKKITEDGQNCFIMLNENNPIITNSENLLNFSYLLSLLINNESDEYFGANFILHDDIDRIKKPEIDYYLNQSVLMFGFVPKHEDVKKDDTLTWKISLPFIKDNLIKTAKEIDNILLDETKEKLLYVSNLLREASKAHDVRLKLMIYVSILELLLTHNPDFSRFNVEDSISKQFQNKVATLVYLYSNRTADLKELKNKLKIIYTQRSNIAHGNFTKYKKFIASLSKKDGKEEYFDSLVSDTIFFIKAVLSEYIKDKEFIEFLKEN